VTIVMGVALGIAPALKAIAQDTQESLKSGASSIASRVPFGRLLLVSQVALCFLLLLGAGLLSATLNKYLHLNTGVDSERLLSVSIDPLGTGYQPSQLPQFYKNLTAVVRNVPGVRSAALAECGISSNCDNTSSIFVPGAKPEVNANARTQGNTVGHEYIRAVGLRLLSGRNFDSRDRADTQRVVLVNHAFAEKYFGDANPVGRFFGFGRRDQRRLQIVGIVSDARLNNIHEEPPPMVYYSLVQSPEYTNVLEVRTDSSPDLLSNSIRSAIRKAEPHLSILRITPQRVQIAHNLENEYLLTKLSAAFAGMALLLACVGLYGVIAYQTRRRTTEIGIRMALGAEPILIGWTIIREALTLVAAGVSCGLALAMVLQSYVRAFLFGISAWNPAILSAAIATLLLTSAIAAYLPARRASSIQPVNALRHE
jgi:predicted permease